MFYIVLKGNMLGIKCPGLPDTLKSRITLLSTCEFSEHEIELFHTAFLLLEKFANLGHPYVEGQRTNMIIFDRDDLTFEFEDLKTLGNYASFIFYPIHRWREGKYSDIQILVCLLEELCHCFWLINDEIIVKHRVTDIVKLLFPDVTFEQLYPGMVSENIASHLINLLQNYLKNPASQEHQHQS